MLKPLGAFSLSSGSLFSAAASGGAGTGASLAAAGLLSGRPISGEPGGSAAAAGAAGAGAAAAGAGAVAGAAAVGAGAGAGVAAGAGAGSGAGVAAGAGAGIAAGAGACAGVSCGCWASAVVARRASVAASNVPRGTRRVITFLPSAEVRSRRLPCRQCPTFRPLGAIGFAHDLANYRSRFVVASHAPVGIRRVVLQRCQRRDLVVARRKMTDRIGGGCIAGERKGLATAGAASDCAATPALG